MANFFDQFDQPQPQKSGNFFDQFDVAQADTEQKEPAYKPVLVPLKRVPEGQGLFGTSIAFGPSELTESVSRAITAPARSMQGEPGFDAVDEARNLAMTFSGTGVATRAARPAMQEGVLAMNAVGPPAKKAAQAVSRAASAVAEPLISRIAPDDTIGRILAKRLMQDNPGLTLDEAILRAETTLAELGPEAVLADVGKSMERLTRNMAQGPGETAQRARDVLGSRQAEEKTRMIGTFKENVSPQLYYDVDAAAEQAMKNASPHFQAAFKANKSVQSPVIDKLLMTPAGRAAMDFARQRVENRMSRMAVPDKELTEQMNDLVARGEMNRVPGGVASGLKMETLDLIRQDLFDQMQVMKRKVAKGDARKGEYNEIKDIYNSFRQALINADVTAKAGPKSTKAGGGEYARGLEKYRDAATLQTALEDGRAFVRGDYELSNKEFNALGNREKTAYRAGVVRQIVELIGRDSSDFTPAQIMSAIKSESILRKKLAVIAPSEQQFNRILKDIERNMKFRETSRGIQNVSQTASIAMEEGKLAAENFAAAGGIVADAARGNLPGAGAKAVQFIMSQLQRLQIPQQARDRLGEMLLSKDPATQKRAFDLIKQAGNSGWVYAP